VGAAGISQAAAAKRTIALDRMFREKYG